MKELSMISLRALVLLLALAVLFSDCEKDCTAHSDCELNGVDSGICYKGKCVCHPSYYSESGCQTVAQFNEPHGRIRYELSYNQVTWEQADMSCKMKLGELTKIFNREQNEYIRNSIRDRERDFGLGSINLFFGLIFDGESTSLQWSDGSRFSDQSFNSWYGSAPTGWATKHIVIDGNGRWSVADPNSRHGFVCEFDGISDYVLHTLPKNYSEAETSCRNKGNDIVSIADRKELAYVQALYSVGGVRAGWVGLYRRTSDSTWQWTDGTTYDSTVLRVGSRDSYTSSNRAQIETVNGNFQVMEDDDIKVPYICKTAKVKRDCGVLKALDRTLPSSARYYVRPREGEESKMMVYCDMTTDGGGYTYHIVKKENGVSTAETIPKFCHDFDPVDIRTPKQVLELRRILQEEDVNLERGVVPIAVYKSGKYRTLSSGKDISLLLYSLEYDYDVSVVQANPGKSPIEGDMLGIGNGHVLSAFRPRGYTIVAVVCSVNNKQVPLESFSAVFNSQTRHLLQYKMERTVSLDNGAVCAWITTVNKERGIVYSMADEDGEVKLQLVLHDPELDHFIIDGRPTRLGDFGVKDGKPHRVCLNQMISHWEVVVDGEIINWIGNSKSRGMLLSGTFTVGGNPRSVALDDFIGTIDSVDIWNTIIDEGQVISKKPLYAPGNVVRWSDFYTSNTNDAIRPAQLFGYSRFKVGIGPSGLRWAHNYCRARGGELGSPRNDYEYTQILQLLQGNSGWINVYRENNTLYSATSTPQINLTYIPVVGPDGNITINGEGDLESSTVNQLLPFLCQFDVEEEMPELPSCLPEEVETVKGQFSWVRASVNSTVKVLCPHGAAVEEDAPASQSYASRTCIPGTSGSTPVWGTADIHWCNYANRMTQQLHSLRKLSVTSGNAAEIASMVLSLTNDTAELDDTGIGMVTDIIEELVDAQNASATSDIAHTLSNLLDVDGSVLSSSQKKDRTSDRILESLEKVAGSIANDSTPGKLDTKNIQILAAKVSNSTETRLSAENGVYFNLPAASFPANKSAYLITYSSTKLFVTPVLSVEEALARHQNKSLASDEFLNTQIISAGVDREVVRDLIVPVSLVFPALNKNAGLARCVYYSSNNTNGEWLSAGLRTSYNIVTEEVTCRSHHMTSFAVLMTIAPETHPLEGTHAVIMNTISYLCLFLSLVGLILTIMALSLQRTLWRLDMTKIHVYLCISLFVGYVLFLVGIDQTQSRALCITSAFLMHLAFLTAFAWMAVEAYTLYLQFVKVFPSYTPNFIPKCMIVVFSVPLAIAGGFLVAALTTDPTQYYELQNYCWIKSYTLYFGFILPILLIVTCNLVLFGYVTRNIWRIVSVNKSEDNQLGKLSVQLRATVSVLVVLGVTWLIGALTFGSASLFFQYIFTILNGLQGFSIFLFHVVLKPEVRKRWYNSIHDITNSLSSNSHALKSNSFHRAHKFQVQNLRGNGAEDESQNMVGEKFNNTSFCSNASQKPLILNDKRFTYLSNSNDYATIDSRPSSVSSAISDNAVQNGAAPLIRHQPATPPQVPPLRDSGTSLGLKRPLSTVPSMETPSTPGDQLELTPSPNGDFAFSPITHPKSWEYNPLRQESPDRRDVRDPLEEENHDEAFLREGEDQV